jgi:hypothetical protein
MSNNTKELNYVLIDADNVPYSNVKGMMEEISLALQLPNVFMQTGPNQMQEVGKRITRACHYTHTAIQLYGRQKIHPIPP